MQNCMCTNPRKPPGLDAEDVSSDGEVSSFAELVNGCDGGTYLVFGSPAGCSTSTHPSASSPSSPLRAPSAGSGTALSSRIRESPARRPSRLDFSSQPQPESSYIVRMLEVRRLRHWSSWIGESCGPWSELTCTSTPSEVQKTRRSLSPLNRSGSEFALATSAARSIWRCTRSILACFLRLDLGALQAASGAWAMRRAIRIEWRRIERARDGGRVARERCSRWI
mmetsp:Transcript_5513/g.16944  ORF Transcript_5513/g.16944 Transcript_5513/m.16944 type:complete len:224 (+) Transcript_5513:1138-1809(+)